MRNISGLIPYQELSTTAKANGGPEQYICAVYNGGYRDGLITAGACAGLGVGSFFLGRWIYKKIKAYMESDSEDTE